MKIGRIRAVHRRLAASTLLVAAGLLTLFLWAVGSWAQAPIPHAILEGMDCLSCHQSGVTGAPRVAPDHLGRTNEDCLHCHHVTGAQAAEIPHPVVGRDDCLSCHLEGVGDTPRLRGDHVDYANEVCRLCHSPSAAALAPTAIPTPLPTPETGVVHAGAGTCASCHQLIFADTGHAVFTGQPVGDAAAGATLFAELCAHCHGEEGTTPVGDEDKVINSEAYWGSHDDAAVLRDIGAGSHGEMAAFAQAYDGPLSWDEILNLSAFVRTWGPIALPKFPSQGNVANGAALFAAQCALCHGDEGQGGMAAPEPINSRAFLSQVTDDVLRQTILEGVSGMPGFAKLDEEQVTDLIAFLRSLTR